jgi:hypothetical protein
MSGVAAQNSVSVACETTASDGPIPVYASFFINSFRDFDTVTETYVVDFFLNLRWEDVVYRNAVPSPLAEAPCFYPQPTFINGAVSQEESSNQPFEIIYSNDDYGIVQWLSRYTVVFNTNLNLRSFPNDSHELPVILEDFIRDRERLVFFYEKPRGLEDGPLTKLEAGEGIRNANDVINEEYLGLQEWEITNVQVAIEENPYSFFDNAIFSQFRFTLSVERDPSFYNFNVVFIMLLIVSMCFAVFFISPEDLVSRLSLAVTIFLSIVAHNYVVQTTLPHIPYLTALDIQMMSAKVIVFLTFFESVIVYILATGSTTGIVISENDNLAGTIDRVTKYIFPIVIIGILFIG